MKTLLLKVMMFLQYFVWGAWYVTLGAYLVNAKGAGGARLFSDTFVGQVYGASAIAAMLAPFLVGLIADRFLSAEKVLFVLHLLGAVFIGSASLVSDPTSLYALILAHLLCYMPTIAISNSLTMKHLSNPQQEFSGIRVLGTIGWIAAGIVVGLLALTPEGRLTISLTKSETLSTIETTPLPLKFACAVQVIMAFFCLALPHTPPARSDKMLSFSEIVGLDALVILKQPSVLVFVLASILICVPLQFYYALTNAYLNEIGVVNAAAKMTLGQASEIVFMLLLPLAFAQLGVRWIMLIGMSAWALRYASFMFGNSNELMPLIYLGIILHGICYDFFFVAGQIYLDSKAPAHLRSAIQGLLTFATYGIGMFVGSILSGVILQQAALDEAGKAHNWKAVWFYPAVLSAIITVVFFFTFRDRIAKPSDEPAADEAAA